MRSACAVNDSSNEYSPRKIEELISKVDALAHEVSEMASLIKDMKETLEKDISNLKVIIVEEMDKTTAKL